MSSVAPPPEELTQDTATDDLPQPDWDGPRCAKCNAPDYGGQVAICPACGWYASMNTFVEIDPSEANRYLNGDAGEQIAPKTIFEVWGGLIPAWGWVLIGTQLGVVIISIVLRVLLPSGTALHAWVGSTQLIVGIAVAMICHFAAFVLAATSDSEIGLFDVIVKPMRGWMKHLPELPSKLTLINTGLSGVVSAICAAAIVGGIPWYVLLDWKFEKREKPNVMGAVMSQVQGAEDDKTLTEAVEDFAGNAEGTAGGNGGGNKRKEEQALRESCNCLILGYEPSGKTRIARLLLAAKHEGTLLYVGQVIPDMSDQETAELRQRLEEHHSAVPFVYTRRTATWVKPKFTCQVTYEARSASGRLTEIHWGKLLGEVETQ